MLPVRVIAGSALLFGVLVPAAVADVMQGTEGPDTIVGTTEDDDIHGLGGDDVLRGRAGLDLVVGGADDDRVYGGGGHDDVRGKGGDDEVYGGRRGDSLRGGYGADVLRGEGHADRLIPGAGRDRVHGGPGDDSIWVFRDGTPDVLDCGGGDEDFVSFSGEPERHDVVRNCETFAVGMP